MAVVHFPRSDCPRLPGTPARLSLLLFCLVSQLHGSKSGGDCDALRIQSTDDVFFNLRGHGGNLDILDTVITSWDTDLAVPGVRDTADYSIETDDADPRSYIRSVCREGLTAWPTTVEDVCIFDYTHACLLAGPMEDVYFLRGLAGYF